MIEIYPHSAKTFLREAEDALKRLKEAKDTDDINRSLITFLNATKHTIYQLNTDFKDKLKGFNDWYVVEENFLIKKERRLLI